MIYIGNVMFVDELDSSTLSIVETVPDDFMLRDYDSDGYIDHNEHNGSKSHNNMSETKRSMSANISPETDANKCKSNVILRTVSQLRELSINFDTDRWPNITVLTNNNLKTIDEINKTILNNTIFNAQKNNTIIKVIHVNSNNINSKSETHMINGHNNSEHKYIATAVNPQRGPNYFPRETNVFIDYKLLERFHHLNMTMFGINNSNIKIKNALINMISLSSQLNTSMANSSLHNMILFYQSTKYDIYTIYLDDGTYIYSSHHFVGSCHLERLCVVAFCLNLSCFI